MGDEIKEPKINKRARRNQLRESLLDDYVFHGKTGGRCLSADLSRKSLEEFIARYQEEFPDLKPGFVEQECRATFKELCHLQKGYEREHNENNIPELLTSPRCF